MTKTPYELSVTSEPNVGGGYRLLVKDQYISGFFLLILYFKIYLLKNATTNKYSVGTRQ